MKPHYKLTLAGELVAVPSRPTAPVSRLVAKKRLTDRGLTLGDFARVHGFTYRTVSEVIRGVNKGRRGEGHRIAVALGLVVPEARA